KAAVHGSSLWTQIGNYPSLDLCQMNFKSGRHNIAGGTIRYVAEDQSIQTVPVPVQAGSILINEVELLLGTEGEVIGISGYCPLHSWQEQLLTFPLTE